MGWIDEMLVGVPVNAVLRERLTLEAEKRVATIAENVALKSENIALRSEKEVLKSQAVNLRQEIQRRDDIIQKEKSHRDALDEVKEKILALLAVQDGIADHDVAQSLNINGQLATFHLQELEANHLARRILQVGARFTPWHITQEGRRYLVTHGLIS